MTKARGSSNNVRAGAFLLLTLLAAFAVVIVLSGVADTLKTRNPFTVRFSLVEGASGLDVGSPVKVAGRPVGRVERITLRTEPSSDAPACVDCEIRIDKGVRFFGSPVAHLEKPLLGAGAELNFPGVGDTSKGEALPVGSVIRGTLAPPGFLAAAGYGDEQKAQLQSILRRADEIASDVGAVTKDVKTRWPTWGDRVDSITGDIQVSAASIRERVEELRGVVSRAREWLDANRDKLTRIVDNVEVATEDGKELLAKLNDQTVDKLHTMLDEGSATAASARKAIERVDELVAEQAPVLRKSLANARLASDQLKLTLAEVRRSPWRLLYRPDTRELEFELLYDAARSYADAVSDLRGAGESLDAAAARAASLRSTDPDAPAALPHEQLSALSDRVKHAFEQYAAAEAALLRLLVETGSEGE